MVCLCTDTVYAYQSKHPWVKTSSGQNIPNSSQNVPNSSQNVLESKYPRVMTSQNVLDSCQNVLDAKLLTEIYTFEFEFQDFQRLNKVNLLSVH